MNNIDEFKSKIENFNLILESKCIYLELYLYSNERGYQVFKIVGNEVQGYDLNAIKEKLHANLSIAKSNHLDISFCIHGNYLYIHHSDFPYRGNQYNLDLSYSN